ncbi:hypothetical protein ACFLIM_28290 [Nonomuraea sp. M3C6]|uniref:Uncharacterized protein n=1 Tax=Nonomuraea marmarensis TaxID=3351344 RepID=A0ABW7ALE1_9ACTN
MRGQEPGSEHDRREADGSAAPATPPPSFGQTSGRDIPPAPTPSDETAEGRPAIPAFHGSPEPGEPTGAQPWEVSDDDAAPYDWFADHTDPAQPDHPQQDRERSGHAQADHAAPGSPPADQTHPSLLPADQARPGHPQADHARPDHPQADHARPDHPQTDREQAVHPWSEGDLPAWPAEPVVPGAPPWEPPPAFTAAAAGMPVWPAPVTEPNAMPPWPAATGELVAEPDADDGHTPDFDPNATNPEGFTRPAHYFPPEAANREPAQPDAAQPGAQEGAAQEPTPQPEGTQPPNTPLPAPIAPQREDTQPFAHDDIARQIGNDNTQSPHPAHYFDPDARKRDATDHAPLFDPHPTNPSARAPEPGDVPVWPPTPHAGEKLPDLPFSRETWGQQRPTTSLDLPAGGPAFPPGAFKQPPFQTPPPPAAPPGRSKRALFVTLGALALAGVATGGFFAYQAVSAPTPTTAAARPTASASAPPSEVATASPPVDVPGTSMLNSEQTDPQKLSLSEAFPKKKVSAAGTTFTRVKADMETNCDKAATGAFADALQEQKCTRVLRATYVDNKRRYAVTTGIAVLPTKDAAATADQAKSLTRNVWFRPLPGAAGSGSERVDIAGGYAAGLVWGRYIVFSYATHADGHTPVAKEKTLPKVSGAFRDQTSLVLERRITRG